MDKVRAGSVYFYDPVPMDCIMQPHGVQAGLLKPGDRVRVVNLPGCPKANTMRMCHIETEAQTKNRRGELRGEFLGLVMVSSLSKEPPKPEDCVHVPAPRVVPPLGDPLPTCAKCGMIYMDSDNEEDE